MPAPAIPGRQQRRQQAKMPAPQPPGATAAVIGTPPVLSQSSQQRSVRVGSPPRVNVVQQGREARHMGSIHPMEKERRR